MLAANILCADDRDAMQKDIEELGQHISAGGTWALADKCSAYMTTSRIDSSYIASLLLELL